MGAIKRGVNLGPRARLIASRASKADLAELLVDLLGLHHPEGVDVAAGDDAWIARSLADAVDAHRARRGAGKISRKGAL